MIKKVIIINIVFLMSLFFLVNVSAICVDSDNSPDYSKMKEGGGSLYLDYEYNEGLSIDKNPDLFVSGVAKGPYIYEDQGNYLGKNGTMNQINRNESELYDSCGEGGLSNQITEAYCTEEGKTAYIGITNCYNGCKDGACLPDDNVSCTDSDEGDDYYTKGYRLTQINGPYNREEDYCIIDPFIYSSGSVVSDPQKKVDRCEGNKCYVIEYHCKDKEDFPQDYLARAHIGFKCPNGCEDGACLKIEPTEETGPIEIPENLTENEEVDEEIEEGGDESGGDSNESSDEVEDIIEEVEKEKEIICNGCVLYDKCYPFGFRKQKNFCSDENNQFIKQKQSESLCNNNFECSSNLCVDNQCISSNLWQKFLKWLSKLFGGGDSSDECESYLDCEESYFEEPICQNGNVAQKEHFFNCVDKKCVEETEFVNRDYCNVGCENGECLDNSFLEENYCEELILGVNDFDASRPNLIFIGFGYGSNPSEGGDIVKEIMSYAIDWEGERFGLFSVEPFKSNKDKFNLWYLNKSLPMSFCKDIGSWDSYGDCITDQEDIEKLLQDCPQENQYIFFLGNSLFRSTGGNPGQLSIIYRDDMKCQDIEYCQNLRDISVHNNPYVTRNSYRYQMDPDLAQDVNNDGEIDDLDLLFSINCPFLESIGVPDQSYPLVECDDELIKFDMQIDRLLVHEFGHQFGNLRDESVGSLGDAPIDPTDYNTNQLTNCLPFESIEDCRENAPWKDLIGNGCGEEGVVDCTNPDGSHPSATDVSDVNENWAVEIDCYYGCKISGTYRSVFDGIMSDLYPESSYRYGLYNEQLIQQKLDTFS
tara:strand:- start:53 stop:2500 length:2448 start_codon:yes stop_codon:yes gene_type:complete